MNNDEVIRAIGNQETSINTLVEEIRLMRTKMEEVSSTCQAFEEYKARRLDHEPRIQKLEKVAEAYENDAPARAEDRKYINDLRTTFKACIIAAGITNSIVLALIGAVIWLLQSGYMKVGV